jgi:hypothetical protein
MRGDWQDFETIDGETRLVQEGRNLIVDSAYKVVAAAMKLDPDHQLWWAVGDGNTVDTATWDAGVLDLSISPDAADTQLLQEIFRKQILPSDMIFVDDDDNESGVPTNRIQITLLLEEDEPTNDPDEEIFLREWGIFGGYATVTPNSGTLLNRKVHVTYEKRIYSQLTRVLRLTF